VLNNSYCVIVCIFAHLHWGWAINDPPVARLDPVTGAPLGCHYGSWNYTDQIDGSKHQPPLLLVHGTHDTTVPIREAEQMARRAAATGLPYDLIAIPGAGHVPQSQLINSSTPYLGQMLASIYKSMDLASAECPGPRKTDDAVQASKSVSPMCELHREQGRRCDGGAGTDDTAALNHALLQCSAQGRPVAIAKDANCTTGPLALPDHSVFRIDGYLQALHRKDWPTKPCGGMVAHRWPPTRGCGNPTDMLTAANINNVTITGTGTIDGRGAEWWPGPWYKRGEPDPGILLFVNTSDVLVEGVTMLNSPNLHISIGDCNHAGIKSVAADVCGSCEDYTIRHITIRAPNFELARNTDGIDIAGRRIHIHDVDIANGDDTIQVKSPSEDVLVENSTVRTGNGVGIGTATHASINNIVFRNIVADDTTFGCHIKFEPPQTGSCSNVLFENISIRQTSEAWRRRLPDPDDHPGYAIGIHQSDQGVDDKTAAANGGTAAAAVALNGRPISQVQIVNVTYRRIRSQGLFGGSFRCQPGELACSGIRLEDVRLNVSRGGCSFANTFGENSGDIEPASCRIPVFVPLKSTDSGGWQRKPAPSIHTDTGTEPRPVGSQAR
jgi:hypothetical protein